jgi:hypothetical protein
VTADLVDRMAGDAALAHEQGPPSRHPSSRRPPCGTEDAGDILHKYGKGDSMQLRFNTLLELAGLDPNKVYLLRHQDSRLRPGRLLSAWLNERDKFQAYQAVQKWENRFPEGSSLASFVVAPGRETLFVGIYDVLRLSLTSGPYEDPLLGKMPAEDRAWHETKHSERMEDYEAKIVIEWGRPRPWRQLAGNQNKLILEIRSRIKEEPFPEYRSFKYYLQDMRHLYPSWIRRLEETRGVYLLVFDDGMQYVGSATGESGFWQRWEAYLANGHGGNKVLLRDQRDARNAMVAILETSGSRETRNDIVKREMFWQQVLGSKAKTLDAEFDS